MTDNGHISMSPTNTAVDHSSEISTRASSGSHRSISPTMTEATSEPLGNDDVFKKSQPIAAIASRAIRARLHGLYEENITAKILRAATTCLENNASTPKLSHLHCRTLICNPVPHYEISRVRSANGARGRKVLASRSRFLDMRLFPRLDLFASRALDQIS